MKLTLGTAGCCAFVLVGLAGCSDESASGQTQRLQAQIQELNQQVRQYRAEVQRSNEKVVAMLQAHGLQSDNPPAAPARADAGSGQSVPGAVQGDAYGDPHGAAHGSPTVTANEAANAMHGAHETMTRQMASVPVTGDADRDFLAQMIPHHQGAIDMAQILIKSGPKTPDMRKFAEDIIAHQQAEIEQMKRWLQVPPQ